MELFVGSVVSTDAGTYNVQVAPTDGNNASILQGFPLAPAFARMLGFREANLPPVGAQVVCLTTSEHSCLIIGIIPDKDPSGVPPFLKTALRFGDCNTEAKNVQGYTDQFTKLFLTNNNRPTDIVEGERAWVNDFGVMLGLFHQLAVLKGSELAQIQCFFIDDLVRIISHNFEHFTSMSETKTYHKGKYLNTEIGLTHLPGEALGQKQTDNSTIQSPFSKEDKGHSDDDAQDFYKMSNEQLKMVERLRIYLGALGDFFNVFLLCRTTEEAPDLSGKNPTTPESGLFNFHLGLDGSIRVRSTKGIAIERTNFIKVPTRIRATEDPKGNDATMEYDEKTLFKFDDSVSAKDRPALYFLQLRDYLAYIYEEFEYKNFKKHDKDFYMNQDVEAEKPLTEISKVDPKTPFKYVSGTSGMYLMDNGGVMFKDAWGSAIVLEGGNIYLQPAKDLVLQPLRNLVAKVGQYTSIASRKDIDFSSTLGGYRLKTEQSQYSYSHASGIILHSDAAQPVAFTPEQDETITDAGGIILKSKEGIYSYAKNALNRITEQSVYEVGSCNWKAESSMTFESDGSIAFKPATDFSLSAQDIYIVADNTAAFMGTAADSGTIIGLKGQTIGMTQGEMPMAVEGFMPQPIPVIISETEDKARQSLPAFAKDEAFDNLKFRFLSTSTYGLGEEDILPQTIAQQEAAQFNSDSLEAWDSTKDSINQSYPYPGGGKFSEGYRTVEMQNLEKILSDIYNKQRDLAAEASIVAADLNEYKVVKQ